MSPWSPPTPTTSAPRSPATTACRAAGRTPGWNGRWPALRGDPAVDWIVVGFHHCAYCTNTLHGSDAGVRRWGPLFDRYGVDLLINGHKHCYERTPPVPARAPVAEVASGGTWASTGGVPLPCV